MRLIRPLIQNPDRNSHRYMTEDFSISYYDMGDHREQGFYSGLNTDTLSFAPVRDIPAEGDIDCRRFIAVMEELAKLEDGTIATGSHVLKWSVRLDESKSWTDKLSYLFGDRNADVFHVLWFNVDDATYNKIRTTLAKIKYKILDGEHGGANSLANKYGIENLWLVKRIEAEHLEPISSGKIHYADASRFNYLMIMQLTREDKLNEFLADRDNTKLRLQLFRELGGDISEFMVAHGVDTIEGLKASPLRQLNYQVLERIGCLEVAEVRLSRR